MLYVSNWLSEAMKSKNISAAKLAKELQLSPATISLWLNNKRLPDYDNLQKLINYFHTTKAGKKHALFSIFYN